jgi:uncharacterized protein (TIGR02466 family)
MQNAHCKNGKNRKARMEILNLFPTAVGIYDLGREFTKQEIQFIKAQETRSNMGNTTSVDHNILEKKQLESVKKFVEDSVAAYFSAIYAPKQDTKLRITQSWCNYTESGQFHHKHAHPNSFISGVLYPQANKETDKIYFFKDAWQQLKTPTEQWNPYNSDSWWLEAFTGRLFIFPSHLTHMVETVEGKDTRISLSFNTFPIGNFGNDQDLTGLTL